VVLAEDGAVEGRAHERLGVDGLRGVELGASVFKLRLSGCNVLVALAVVDQMEVLFRCFELLLGDVEVAAVMVKLFAGDDAGIKELLAAVPVGAGRGLDGFCLMHGGGGFATLLRARSVVDSLECGFGLMDLGAAAFDLGMVVVVDENGEDLALHHGVAFFGEDLLELAGKLGADLDVFGIGLDEAWSGDYGLGDGRLVRG
jgi:hypothetical protein